VLGDNRPKGTIDMAPADNTVARTLHDVGLAAWFGGSLMGATGVNGAAAVAGQALAGASGARLGTPGDERPPWRQRGQGLLGRTRHEPAVHGDLTRSKAQPVQLGGGLLQQAVLAGLPGALAAGSTSPRAPRRVVAVTLSELGDVAELAWLAELALTDRAGIRVTQRHQPVAELLAPHPLLDLGGNALAARSQVLQPPGGTQLGLGAPPARRAACLRGQPARLTDRAAQRPPGRGVERQDLIDALAGAPGQGLGDRPHQLADPPGAVNHPGGRAAQPAASFRPARANARAPCRASTPSDG
jgi:hypothetical protein